GSGCIAVSLAKLCPGLMVDAADISEEALAVAMENAGRLEADVAFWQGDLFDCHPVCRSMGAGRGEGSEARERGLQAAAYDCIVSNPPYIRTAVIETLSDEVRLHEPYQALDGKEDGLYFYRKIISEARGYLKPGGFLFFEIGYDQGEAVKRLLEEEGYIRTEIRQDLAGLDRVVCGIYP
ncbi:MAG: HemK/PrmC family methyltransferase, partial [Lachnospiraceae bacterium]